MLAPFNAHASQPCLDQELKSLRPMLPVSILIPCCNSERWLSATIESALGQTWPSCEVIVVDDGSTDSSLAIARRFESRGVRVASQSNRGAAAARNHALRLCHGKLIKFLDADDLISPNMISTQAGALESSAGKVAYGEWARFTYEPGEARFHRRAEWRDGTPVDWLVEAWREGQPMMQCAQYLLPRALIERAGGWDERLSLIDDFEFFTRVTLASDGVVFTPGAKLYYRSGLPHSLSGTKSGPAWQSAVLSTRLATNALVAAENSPRTRAAAAAILQALVHDMYPAMPELIAELEARVAEFGGSGLVPRGGFGFEFARRLLGWKAARRLQILTGKFPRALP